MALKLVGIDEVRIKKINDIRCRFCKGDKTIMLSNGKLVWIRDKDIRGDWTGLFICYQCYYKKDKVCYRCGSEQIVESMQMYRHYDKEEWTGKYICQDCHRKENEEYKNRNIMLRIEEGAGSILDIVVSTVLDVPIYSICIVDKRLPFSIIHEYYGIVGIKTSKLRYNLWRFNINDYISADTYFLICFDAEFKNIDAMYVVPVDERRYNNTFHFYKDSNKYKEFKIDHTPYNIIFKNLIKK